MKTAREFRIDFYAEHGHQRVELYPELTDAMMDAYVFAKFEEAAANEEHDPSCTDVHCVEGCRAPEGKPRLA